MDRLSSVYYRTFSRLCTININLLVIIMQINDKLETQKWNLFRKRIFDEKLVCDLEDIGKVIYSN